MAGSGVSTRRNLVVGWMLALLAIALFVVLGFWQLDRGHKKQAVLTQVQAVLAERRAQPLVAASDMARARAYDWAAGSGVFIDAPAVLLDNQQREGRPGVRVYRVFAPTQGATLLVELGWLPLPGARRMPDVPRPQGSMRIEGLLAPRPSHGIATAVAVPLANGALLTIGLEAANLNLALRQPRLAPRVLKLDPVLPLGYARDLDVLPNTLPPQRHLGYAVQWFALALAVLVTTLVLSLRKPRRKRAAP